MEALKVIKIGGNVLNDSLKANAFLDAFAKIAGPKLLVHGGGVMASEMAQKLNVPQQLIDGRRVTDTETLKIATMVYAGYINKNLVAKLQARGINALGLTGADLNSITSTKRVHPTIDFGYVGDIQTLSLAPLLSLFSARVTPVFCAITHDGQGQLLNTNADTLAAKLAIEISKTNPTELFYCFEKLGVLADPKLDSSVIPKLNVTQFERLKKDSLVSAGMIPKLENAFFARQNGVLHVRIGNAERLLDLTDGKAGTEMELT